MSRYIPHHLYAIQETTPFDMKYIPAANICNRAVIRKYMYAKGDSPVGSVWVPESNKIITAWSSGKWISVEGISFSTTPQSTVIFSGFGYFFMYRSSALSAV